MGHSFVVLGYLPEKDAAGKEQWPLGDEKAWKEGLRGVYSGVFFLVSVLEWGSLISCGSDVSQITKSVVNHVQTSLARQPYNLGAVCICGPIHY